MTALYIERYLNWGLTREELQSGRPLIGIAQTGSDLSPCNRIHVELASRVRDGIRDAGGVPFEFPCHPIQETGRRPTAALDRNLSYLSLVEVLHGYPLDGVVLTTGCDKTTPALLMAAATADLPAIVLSGGPMLDGWRLLSSGEIGYSEFMDRVCASAPSPGQCSRTGTASEERAGLSCAAVPAPYRERAQYAYRTGQRAVGLVHEDLRPSAILTRPAFLNAIRASETSPEAIARHAQAELHDLPLLVNVIPSGQFLCESFYRAGGVPAAPLTVTGRSVAENDVIRTAAAPLRARAGFRARVGNLFDSALLKTREGVLEARAIVFEGPEDYHGRINDPELADCILFIRYVGPVGYPGSAEVVNMQPPDALISRGVDHLPYHVLESTSESPSILNASPEAAVGGALAILRTGDTVRLDVAAGSLDVVRCADGGEITPAVLEARWAEHVPPPLPSQTPWQEIYRATVGQLETGGCLELATRYKRVAEQLARDNH
ncbi:dihydroxy-acid dehydratase [Emiliania huxleyi CCMP1516]|uniref:Dihydroxy-acid dehydratase n=2 Tax=Emiliania huxleyi TaxID=2903 RepID=A0A0D3HYH6_EMIH1|nr:dihydroxy-acid dehydratase [Emiliania huxleyi CCMP1516]EOD04061.1 dihydroxy-acid dehydratase [Emiliania huxleyi CCMP1516]|eukprot:XP_005756490.1 dihydroxy-acid dehydratase [Emiliania huxleyi CCMP1516]